MSGNKENRIKRDIVILLLFLYFVGLSVHLSVGKKISALLLIPCHCQVEENP